MDTKALALESRFSLPPNFLGYCGQKTASQNFRKCIISGDCAPVETEITKFIVLYPYLKTIAQINNLSPFSYKVIESYWLGNDLLNNNAQNGYDMLLDNLLTQGVPDFFVNELRNKKPKVFIPSHLFHVLFIGVGRASGAVPFNMDSINNCMIRWGKIIEIIKNKAVINLTSLTKQKSRYVLINKTETIPFDSLITPDLHKNHTVAVHWNFIIKKLTPEETKKLKYWTNTVIKSL